jgi:mRNA-degrading endonuclease RelE of RelBE toxin-antitoxin system
LPKLALTREARENLAALPPDLRGAVAETINRLALDPQSVGKPLIGRLRGRWSAAIGSYRVLYTIEPTGIVIRAIRHRAVAYRARRRRQK